MLRVSLPLAGRGQGGALSAPDSMANQPQFLQVIPTQAQAFVNHTRHTGY